MNTSQLERFGVSMESELIESFDKLISKKGYPNRSEAIRDLVRNLMVEEETKLGTKEVIGTITIVYSHHIHDLTDTLNHIQHDFHDQVISTVHVHLDEHNCLEVLIVKGKGKEIKKIADKLISTKGVKHGKLTITTTGKDLR
ncbi:nickel-responsive transcriptional regulator NikR [Candidatus Margulisiibacteriota bacterium]